MQRKVLVVDDEIAIRRLFEDSLTREGFFVESAQSGVEALLILEREKFDLILLDLRMPDFDGVETLRSIREFDKETPIYIVSGFYNDYMSSLKEVASAGVDFEVMDKPIGRNQILSIVNNTLSGPLTCQEA